MKYSLLIYIIFEIIYYYESGMEWTYTTILIKECLENLTNGSASFEFIKRNILRRKKKHILKFIQNIRSNLSYSRIIFRL